MRMNTVMIDANTDQMVAEAHDKLRAAHANDVDPDKLCEAVETLIALLRSEKHTSFAGLLADIGWSVCITRLDSVLRD